jgi:hypothetical protein
VADFVSRYTEPVTFVTPGHATKPPQSELVLKKNADACVFLKDDECGVHVAKPDGCRLGPFTYGIVGSDRNWAHFRQICPGIGRGPEVTWQAVRDSLEAERAMLTDAPLTTEEIATQLGLDSARLPPLQTILLTDAGVFPDFNEDEPNELTSP